MSFCLGLKFPPTTSNSQKNAAEPYIGISMLSGDRGGKIVYIDIKELDVWIKLIFHKCYIFRQ